MRAFILYSAFISAIYALPINEIGKWDHHVLPSYLSEQLGACDASGLPSSVIESLDMDPKDSYELNEDFIMPIIKSCFFRGAQNMSDVLHYDIPLQQQIIVIRARLGETPELRHSLNVAFAVGLKIIRHTGEMGVTVCSNMIEEIRMCREIEVCSWNNPKFDELREMSSEERDEELDSLQNNLAELQETFAKLSKSDGNSVLDLDLSVFENPNKIIADIWKAAAQPSQEWMQNCTRPYIKTSLEAFVEYCTNTIEN